MKALKTVLIVLFAFLLAVSGGVLVYGAVVGTSDPARIDEVTLDPPANDLYIGEYINQKINISAIANATDMQKNQKVAEMIVKTSYNNAIIDHFLYKAHVDVNSTKTSDYAFSDYFRAKTGMDQYYQTFAYTGSANPVKVKVFYGTDRLDAMDPFGKYDKDTGAWSASLKNPDRKDYTPGLPGLTPYHIYSWYDFPLDLGGLGTAKSDDERGRSEAIDGSLIDASSVVIEEKIDQASNVAYYQISFKAIIAAANASSETLDRFCDSCGGLKDAELYELNFLVEIWKDAGVFRRIGFDARTVASLQGKKGEVKVEKMLKFTYDKVDSSVAAHIKKLADQYGQKWVSKLRAENQEKLNAQLAALPEKNTDEAAGE